MPPPTALPGLQGYNTFEFYSSGDNSLARGMSLGLEY